MDEVKIDVADLIICGMYVKKIMHEDNLDVPRPMSVSEMRYIIKRREDIYKVKEFRCPNCGKPYAIVKKSYESQDYFGHRSYSSSRHWYEIHQGCNIFNRNSRNYLCNARQYMIGGIQVAAMDMSMLTILKDKVTGKDLDIVTLEICMKKGLRGTKEEISEIIELVYNLKLT